MDGIQVRKKKRKARNFTQVDNAIFEDPRVTPQMRYVYICLWKYANDEGENSFPSLTTLTRLTKYGRKTVVDAIQDLCHLNLVEKINRKKPGKPEVNDNNLYILDFANDVLLKENPLPSSGENYPPSSEENYPSSGENEQQYSFNNTPYNNKRKKKNVVVISKKVEAKKEKLRRNIHISKKWNKGFENKIARVFKEKGEEYTLDLLERLYKYNQEIKTTLVQLVNGFLKNMNDEKDNVEVKVEEEILEAEIIEEKAEELKDAPGIYSDEEIEAAKVIAKNNGLDLTIISKAGRGVLTAALREAGYLA